MSNNFSSYDEYLNELLQHIEDESIQLPDFQRDWVWSDYKIRSLIASVSCNYPVGVLMFLENDPDNLHFKTRSFKTKPSEIVPKYLVLDGQQRLTALYRTMFCKEPVVTTNDVGTKIKRYYYIDIEKCISDSEDRIDAIISVPEDKVIRSNFNRDVDLDLSTTELEYENKKFPVNLIFNAGHDKRKWNRGFEKYYKDDEDLIDKFETFCDIIDDIESYRIPRILIEKGVPKQAVCQVFENVNTGGVTLTVFELLTATFAADDFDLREDWKKQKNKMNDDLSDILGGVDSPDFLTAVTLMATHECGKTTSCKKKDILNLTLNQYKKYADRVTDGFIRAAHMLREKTVFSYKDLPYPSQLVPMSVILALLGNKIENMSVKEKVTRWYWCGVFGEMYGHSNDTRYVKDVTEVLKWVENDDEDEPDTVQRSFFSANRLISLQTRNSAAYKGIMALIYYDGAKDFRTGDSMSYRNYSDLNIDIHHIFPKHYCEKQGYQYNKYNSVVNKTPISSRTNEIIGTNAPSLYLKKIETEIGRSSEELDEDLQEHYIDPDLIRSDDFDGFLASRASKILDRIEIATGKKITDRDSKDIIQTYGTSI